MSLFKTHITQSVGGQICGFDGTLFGSNLFFWCQATPNIFGQWGGEERR